MLLYRGAGSTAGSEMATFVRKNVQRGEKKDGQFPHLPEGEEEVWSRMRGKKAKEVERDVTLKRSR